MRLFLIILLIVSYISARTQYTIERIYYDGEQTDTTYTKAGGKDTLYRLVNGEYVFALKAKFRRYTSSSDVVGGGGSEAFPVGSVFISVVSTNPNTLLGYGTWQSFGAGRVLIGQDAGDSDFDVAEETGGSKTKTITAGNLPQLSVTVTDPGHNHVITELRDATTGAASTNIALTNDASSTLGTKTTGNRTTGITATANTGGANTALNIMPPTIVVYFWKRTN